jgi:hypothetical protein
MSPPSLAGREAAQHAGQLPEPLVSLDPPHGGPAALAIDHQVGVGEGRHLREVGHHQNLPATGQSGQLLSHRQRGRSADAGVDLVEGNQRCLPHSGGEVDG